MQFALLPQLRPRGPSEQAECREFAHPSGQIIAEAGDGDVGNSRKPENKKIDIAEEPVKVEVRDRAFQWFQQGVHAISKEGSSGALTRKCGQTDEPADIVVRRQARRTQEDKEDLTVDGKPLIWMFYSSVVYNQLDELWAKEYPPTPQPLQIHRRLPRWRSQTYVQKTIRNVPHTSRRSWWWQLLLPSICIHVLSALFIQKLQRSVSSSALDLPGLPIDKRRPAVSDSVGEMLASFPENIGQPEC